MISALLLAGALGFCACSKDGPDSTNDSGTVGDDSAGGNIAVNSSDDLIANTSEMETYVVTGVDLSSETVTLQSTDGEIYANTPMLLKRKDNTVASVRGLAPASALTSPTDVSPYYIGGVSDLNGYSNVYILAGSEFVKADLSGTDLSFNPEKCFLALDGVTVSARLFISGNTTGVDSVKGVQPLLDSDQWYSLSGQKLDGKPTKKGLYIHNGKKVSIKDI